MSSEHRPTDEQLRDWVDPDGTGFPAYWESEHYQYLNAMFTELLELRARPRIGHAGGPQYWCPKNLREHLCVQQHHAPDDHTRTEIGRLIALLDVHRPLGSNGKHGEKRHTPTCGCEDR